MKAGAASRFETVLLPPFKRRLYELRPWSTRIHSSFSPEGREFVHTVLLCTHRISQGRHIRVEFLDATLDTSQNYTRDVHSTGNGIVHKRPKQTTRNQHQNHDETDTMPCVATSTDCMSGPVGSFDDGHTVACNGLAKPSHRRQQSTVLPAMPTEIWFIVLGFLSEYAMLNRA